MRDKSQDLPRLEHNSVDSLNFLRVAATMFVFILHGRSYVEGVDDGHWLFAMLTNFPAWAGVWILFFLSGYLLCKGFVKNRYPVFEGGKIRPKELWGFYVKRFMKIAPAYYVYMLLFVVIRADDYFFSDPLTALKLFTFSFNGNGGISGIGHLWYLSLAMWFYVFAPFFYWVIDKIKTKGGLVAVLSLTVILGAALRSVTYFTDLAWYEYTYTFLPCNIDLFFGGMLACALTEKIKESNQSKNTLLKIASGTLFGAIFLFNTYVYWKEIYWIYQYVLPTAYLLGCAFMLCSFDSENKKRTKPTWDQIKKNPLRLIDRFSAETYTFYIFHIVAFHYITSVLSLWEGFEGLSVYARYAIFMSASFVVSLVMGVLFYKMISAFGAKKKAPAEIKAA